MSDLSTLLPEISLFSREWDKSQMIGFSDHYGALYNLRNYCNLPVNKFYFLGLWQHGVFGPWSNIHPGFLTYNLDDKGFDFPFYVGRQDQVDYLKQCGFTNAHAIGMPILYANQMSEVERVPDSLLIMPPHTLKGVTLDNENAMSAYVDDIMRFASKFKSVYACLHTDCIENGYWVDDFQRNGVKIISGANTGDLNALQRQVFLYRKFDCVSTSSWGSHVAFALHYGCKVSIYGTTPTINVQSLLSVDSTHKKRPENLDLRKMPEFLNARDAVLSKFYVTPDYGVADTELGSFLLGAKHLLTPRQIKKLLQWGSFERLHLSNAKKVKLQY